MMLLLLALCAVSGWNPYDRLTWWMEVAPVCMGVPILWFTHRKYPFTTLLYTCLFFHGIVLIAGGAYTYARVPLGYWLQDMMALDRNPYDKIGHFLQGFVPAMIAREVLLGQRHMQRGKMATMLCVCVALAVSAVYEMIEWTAALALGQGADEFLGTQGDPWDTQSDMAMALLGAILALVVLSKIQDRQLKMIS